MPPAMQNKATPTDASNATLTGRPVISATGLFTPAESITNAELVESFNTYVDRHNAANATAIEKSIASPNRIESNSATTTRA